MRTKNLLFLSSLACASFVSSAALSAPEETVDTRPAAPRGIVTIDAISGTVHVIGWARSEVDVKDSSGGSDPSAQFMVEGDRTRVQTRGGTLEVHVPVASTLEVRGSSIDVSVRDVTGALRLDTISGDIVVAGAPASISARSASGSVTIDATSAQTNVRTISGDIQVHGARGTASIESVGGQCHLRGGAFNHVDMRSTSGDLTFEGQLAAQASFDVRSYSGDVAFIVPSSTNGNFELRSFHGSIESRLGPSRTANGSLDFKAGTGGAVVRVQTFTGDIAIDVRSGSPPSPPAPPAPPAPPRAPAPPAPPPSPPAPPK